MTVPEVAARASRNAVPGTGGLVRSSSLARAMRAVPAGARVVASPCCATPTTLLGGLAQRSSVVPGLRMSAGLLFGDAPYAEAVLTGRLGFRSWQLSATGRRLAAAGAVEYVPARARDVVEHLRSGVDVALVRVTPPDRYGTCSLGPSASYSKELLEHARVRIAEVDPSLPRTLGADVTVPCSLFDHVVDSESPMPTAAMAPPSETANAIAEHVVGLVRDGATLQLGIGAVPEAVARHIAESDVADLRLVGLLSDAVVPALRSGKVRTEPGAARAVELLGAGDIFEFAHENPAVTMMSSCYVHDPLWLAGQPRLLSVCSALEVDLSGQVASEQVAGRLVSGVGGSADFFEGAGLSAGGRRIVALASTTSSGRSRIRGELDPSTAVTLPRHSVDVVVTEYGAAELAGRSLAERAEALAWIAHPDHRDDLHGWRPAAN